MNSLRDRPTGVWRKAAPAADDGASIGEFLVISALMLFWEICLIRWISTEIRVFAYYKNLSLFAAFLGFGIGLLTSKQPQKWLSACIGRLALLILVVVLYPISPLRIETAPAFFEEFTWLRQFASFAVTAKFYGVILLIFGLNAAAFVPWGRRIGFYFDRLRPIPAYSMNVLANLGGIVLFSLISLVGAPPVAWVLLGFVPLFLIRRGSVLREPRAIVWALLAVIVTCTQFLVERESTYWSPYYKITIVEPGEPGSGHFHTLQVNHDYHQRILDLSPEHLVAQPALRPWALAYDLPYRIGQAGRVLVIGAGTGNDVAAALRHGAVYVAAVEIDPTILAIGKDLHAEKPYESARVEAVVSDARTYLSNPPNTPFDMIVFGLLDSHTQVSGMTSLRLDNFVYTQESFAQARDMLDPNHGLLALSFSAGYFQSPWTLRRVYRMLSESFGSPPKVMFTGYDAGVLFLSGPAARNHPFFEGDDFKFLHQAALKLFDPSEAITEPAATDDWPFLYLKHRAIPLEYWIMMALIATVSGAWVILVNRKQRIGGLSFHFFLLGGAFLLIEVRNLVAFSLMFGSTWQANNLAIGGVLIMILLANLVASRVRSLNPHVLYIVLLSILVVGVFVGPDSFQGLSRGVRLVIVPLWLSIPIFCAGLVFIRSFSRTVYTAGALGANLIGGICGGLLENVSLALGIQSLQFIAIALYVSSWIAMPRHADSGAQPDGGRDAAATG